MSVSQKQNNVLKYHPIIATNNELVDVLNPIVVKLVQCPLLKLTDERSNVKVFVSLLLGPSIDHI